MHPIQIVLTLRDGEVVGITANVPTVYVYHNVDDENGPDNVSAGAPGDVNPEYVATIFARVAQEPAR